MLKFFAPFFILSLLLYSLFVCPDSHQKFNPPHFYTKKKETRVDSEFFHPLGNFIKCWGDN